MRSAHSEAYAVEGPGTPPDHPSFLCSHVCMAVLFTNNGWLISGDAILSTFGGSDGIQSAVLINDFVGCGYGALTVNHATECRKLNAAVAVPGAPIACVGAGTGLGECYLTTSTADPTSYTCFASEGGHAEFAPRSAVEFELLTFLRKKFGGNHRVSVERVVSGTGLANVYEFFAGRYPEKVAKEVHEEFLNAGSMQVSSPKTHPPKREPLRTTPASLTTPIY